MTPLAHLTAARALVADPKDWTQGMSGRTTDGGAAVNDDMSDASAVCSLGALWKASGNCHSSRAEALLGDIVRATTPFDNIVQLNDDPATTHADILRVFDAAIARAAQE